MPRTPPRLRRRHSILMRKRLGILIFVYGVVLSAIFLLFTMLDYANLIQAVKGKNEHIEMRHRLNVFAEGVWFLLANLIAISGLKMASETRPSDS
jgi:hypothetical protein